MFCRLLKVVLIAKDNDYGMYLQDVKEYEKSQIKTHGKTCSSCKFYEITVVDEYYKHTCKIFGIEKNSKKSISFGKMLKLKDILKQNSIQKQK